ncbi:MAG: alpha-amylase, partial [Spirochaetales bacterium]|nr:alpha-amylase [Spirochaetales bacterium]
GTRAVYMQGLGSTFHFDLGTRIVDMIRTGDGGRNNLANTLFADYETYREFNPDYVDAPFLTNHDQNRISGMLKGDPAQLKLSASLYLFAEGVPFIYYGEEIGLMGAKPDEQIRTPMLWNDPGKDRLQTSWIESKYNRNTIPVARQNRDKDSLLNYYRRAVRAKTAHPALYRGRLSPFDTGISSIVSWKMSDSAQTAYVFHNVSSESVALSLPFGPEYSLVFATYAETRANPDGTITLPPRGSAVFADSVKE